MSTRFELMKVGDNEAASLVLVKTVGIVTVL
jgi:hypothetical protein